jgi:putative FmdB family regulatory protein
MPLYEYQCQDCGARYERIEHVSAMHDGVCPECGGVAHRLVSAPALQFKGSGWYVTDYGKGNGGTPSTSATHDSGAPPTSSTESSSTESSSTGSSSTDGPSKASSQPAKTDSKVA